VLWGHAASTLGRVSVHVDGHEVPIAKYSEANIDASARLAWRVELQPQAAGGTQCVTS